MNNVDEAEIQRRNRYWAEHWDEFSCFVVVQNPHNANAHVGGFLGGSVGLFGSIPVPMHTTEIDRGVFSIRDGNMIVEGQYRTYVWPMTDTRVRLEEGRVEVRQANRPVITLLGPVAAPIIGAYQALGLPSV